MMELKDYQKRVLNQISAYIEQLNIKAEIKRKLTDVMGTQVPFNVPHEAWKAIGLDAAQYHPWKNGVAEDVPFICFKVPTGGGKTLLAAHSLGRIIIDAFHRQTGLILWVVPTTEIYRQTLRALRDKQHPYRQQLDQVSGNRVLILEKVDKFTPAQIASELIVMILMLPSANRSNQDTLRMFQGNGGFGAFFPPEDDVTGHANLLNICSNLDCYNDPDPNMVPSKIVDPNMILPKIVKPSLGNVVRLLHPTVILDEGHKAYSKVSRDTIKNLNPCFVLELTATPQSEANVLISVSGSELNREQMIKLDLNVTYKVSPEWKDTLYAGVDKLGELETAARDYQSNGGAYIRPICLVQVERTGRDQRDGQHIHAEDARDYLIAFCGIPDIQIAIKSSAKDELENIELLSENCPIRYIITKRALQEGWDCPFAYVLVILPNSKSMTAVTQLIGRILRQPGGRKTNMKLLDESYVFCYRQSSENVIDAIRKGFMVEGLGDLTTRIVARDEHLQAKMETIHYRTEFKPLEGKVLLPRFAIHDGQITRDLSYSGDILRNIDWSQIDLNSFNVTVGSLDSMEDRTERVGLTQDHGIVRSHLTGSKAAPLHLDRGFLVQQIADVLPNPWIAWDVVTQALEKLHDISDDQIARESMFIVERLRAVVKRERDRLAADLFVQMLADQQIQFFIQSVHAYSLPITLQSRFGTKRMVRDDNTSIQRSLFEYQSTDNFNDTESSVAIYLDKQANLLFWYRNLVGEGNFSIQGWEDRRIWPDFVATKRIDDTTDYNQLYVLETKGMHLAGNADTQYKKDVFALCNNEGTKINWSMLGAEFVNKKIEFKIVYENEWQELINELFQ